MLSAALAFWCSLAVAGAPNYDAFSEPDGYIATVRQELAAWAMMRDPEQLEAVYADAAKGNERAVHVFQQLEATLSASGRELAERVNRPGCLLPGAQQLEKTCRPDWSFLDFLSKERSGGIRLRTAIFTAFTAHARERGLQNQAILSAVNGLLALTVAEGVLRAPKVVPTAPKPLPAQTALPSSPGPAAPVRNGAEQSALIDMAKRDKRSGVTPGDAQAYKELGKEVGVPIRGPEVHPNRPHGKEPHIHVGPVDHIPVRPERK